MWLQTLFLFRGCLGDFTREGTERINHTAADEIILSNLQRHFSKSLCTSVTPGVSHLYNKLLLTFAFWCGSLFLPTTHAGVTVSTVLWSSCKGEHDLPPAKRLYKPCWEVTMENRVNDAKTVKNTLAYVRGKVGVYH